MKRIISTVLTAILGGIAVLGIIPGTALPAAALCNNMSSLKCDANTLAIMAESGGVSSVTGGTAVVSGSTAVGSAATASGVTGGVTLGGSAIATGGSVLATATGLGLLSWLIDTDDPELELAVQPSAVPGWGGGDNLGSNVVMNVVSAPAVGVAGTVTLQAHSDVPVGHYHYITATSFKTNDTSSSPTGVNFGTIGNTPSQKANLLAPVTRTLTVQTGWDRVEVTYNYAGSPPNETLIYWPPGGAGYEDGVGGLIGAMEATYHCQGATGTDVTFTSTGVSGSGSVPLEMPGFECGPAEMLIYAIVEWVTSTGTQTVYEYTAPEWVQDIPVEFPNCLSGECTLRLYKQVPLPHQYCGEAAVGCPDWWTDPNKADNYECQFGAYPVPLGQCSIYRKPGEVKPNTRVDVDPDGKVKVNPPVVSTDPDDFVEIDTITPVPPVPPVPPVADPTVDTVGECFPSGWGVLNPVEWVYRPIKCAFVWAFIPPDGAVEDEIETWRDGILDRPPFSIIAGAVPLLQGFWQDSATTCGLGSLFGDTVPGLVIPCEPPIAGWNTYYVMMEVIIWTSIIWTGARMVASGLGNRE